MSEPMTPDQAVRNIDFLISEGFIPSLRVRHALETLAAMKTEWAVQVSEVSLSGQEWTRYTAWYATREEAYRALPTHLKSRVVYRRVSEGIDSE